MQTLFVHSVKLRCNTELLLHTAIQLLCIAVSLPRHFVCIQWLSPWSHICNYENWSYVRSVQMLESGTMQDAQTECTATRASTQYIHACNHFRLLESKVRHILKGKIDQPIMKNAEVLIVRVLIIIIICSNNLLYSILRSCNRRIQRIQCSLVVSSKFKEFYCYDVPSSNI